MKRYAAIPLTVFFNSRGRSTPKISWRVIDTTQGHNERFYPRKTLASAESQELAQQIVDMLNAEIRAPGRERLLSDLLASSIKTSKTLRDQLFEAREQRDEARAERASGFFVNASAQCFNEHGDAELVSDILKRVQKAEAAERTMRLEAARALTERDELQAKLDKLLGGASPADNEILLALARHINRVCFKS